MNFFLHRSKADTKDGILLYHDVSPYPLIASFVMSKDDTQAKVELWIEKRFDDIKERLSDISDYIKIPKEIFKKGM